MSKQTPEETAAELRELLRECNGTIGEMSRLIRECRSLIASGADAASDAMLAAADVELGKWYERVQKEMNKNSARLNEVVLKARYQVVRQLIPLNVTFARNGRAVVEWKGGSFVEDAEVRET